MAQDVADLKRRFSRVDRGRVVVGKGGFVGESPRQKLTRLRQERFSAIGGSPVNLMSRGDLATVAKRLGIKFSITKTTDAELRDLIDKKLRITVQSPAPKPTEQIERETKVIIGEIPRKGAEIKRFDEITSAERGEILKQSLQREERIVGRTTRPKEKTKEVPFTPTQKEKRQIEKLEALTERIKATEEARKRLGIEKGVERISQFSRFVTGGGPSLETQRSILGRITESAVTGLIGSPFFALDIATRVPEIMGKTTAQVAGLLIKPTRELTFKEMKRAGKAAIRTTISSVPEAVGFGAGIAITATVTKAVAKKTRGEKPGQIDITKEGKPIIKARFKERPKGPEVIPTASRVKPVKEAVILSETLTARTPSQPFFTTFVGGVTLLFPRGKKGQVRFGRRRTSKAELRKKSRQQVYDPRFFTDIQKGEVGVKIRGKGLKERGVKERIIRRDIEGVSSITDVGRSPITGKREALVTRGEQSFIQRSSLNKKKPTETQRVAKAKRGARDVQKFLESPEGSQIRGLIALERQAKPQKQLELIKRKPQPTPKTETTAPPTRLLTKKQTFITPRRKAESIPKVAKESGEIRARPGFRPGISRRIEAAKVELGATPFQALSEAFRKRRRFILVEEQIVTPRTKLPAILKPKDIIIRQRPITDVLISSRIIKELQTRGYSKAEIARIAQTGIITPKAIVSSIPLLGVQLKVTPLPVLGLATKAKSGLISIVLPTTTTAQDISQALSLDQRAALDTTQIQSLDQKQIQKQIQEPTPSPLLSIATPSQPRTIEPIEPFREVKPTPRPPRRPPKRKPPKGPPKKPPRGPPPTIPKIDKDSLKLFRESGLLSRQAYNVYVKSKGKNVKLNKVPLPENKAWNLMAEALDNTTSATGFIKEKGRTTISDDAAKSLLAKFRKGKQAGSFVELNKNRIDTQGEFQGITVEGWKAKKKKAALSPFLRSKKQSRKKQRRPNFL